MGKLLLRLTIFASAVLLVFQNCGNDADFAQDVKASVALNQDLGNGENEDLGVIDEVCNTLPRKTQKINVQFPKPTVTCAWNENGNMSERDAYFRARIELKRNLGLPIGAVICDAQFDFKPQPYKYDDYFALLFNNNIIASGYDFRDNLTPENFGLLRYDWNQIRGVNMDFGSEKEQVFCPKIAGASSVCKFPGHDTQGIIDLDLDTKYVRAIMSNGIPSDHSFTLVTFGDNDEGDCEHSDVEFDVTVTYILTN